jgi:hypothetical protein
MALFNAGFSTRGILFDGAAVEVGLVPVEAVPTGTNYNDTISESVASAESVAAVLTAVTTTSDAATAAESAAAVAAFVTTTSDGVTAADAVTGGLALAETVSESVTGTDSLAAALAMAATASESVTAAESLAAALAMAATASESVTAAEALDDDLIHAVLGDPRHVLSPAARRWFVSPKGRSRPTEPDQPERVVWVSARTRSRALTATPRHVVKLAE